MDGAKKTLPPVRSPRVPAASGVKTDGKTWDLLESSPRSVRSIASSGYSTYRKESAGLDDRTAAWNPVAWLQVRQNLLDSGRIAELPSLMRCVRQGSSRALQSMNYQVPGKAKAVDLSKVLLHPGVRWFGRRNVRVPTMAQRSAKSVEPPIVVVAASPLDVFSQIRASSEFDNRRISMVVELTEFDNDGFISMGSERTTPPVSMQNLLIRTDFSRFAEDAKTTLRSGQCSVRDHLTARHDPYVFACPGITNFRGQRDDGFPFVEQPNHLCAIVCAMPSVRPAMTTTTNRNIGEKTEWYAYEADQTALLERLSLIGFAALQDQDPTEKGILILSALGCTDRGLHPRNAVANSLKHWRTRFARFFHTVILACGNDADLAGHFDIAINSQIYSALVSRNVTDFIPWHWHHHMLAMHVSAEDMQVIGIMYNANAQANRVQEFDDVCSDDGSRRASEDAAGDSRRASVETHKVDDKSDERRLTVSSLGAFSDVVEEEEAERANKGEGEGMGIMKTFSNVDLLEGFSGVIKENALHCDTMSREEFQVSQMYKNAQKRASIEKRKSDLGAYTPAGGTRPGGTGGRLSLATGHHMTRSASPKGGPLDALSECGGPFTNTSRRPSKIGFEAVTHPRASAGVRMCRMASTDMATLVQNAANITCMPELHKMQEKAKLSPGEEQEKLRQDARRRLSAKDRLAAGCPPDKPSPSWSTSANNSVSPSPQQGNSPRTAGDDAFAEQGSKGDTAESDPPSTVDTRPMNLRYTLPFVKANVEEGGHEEAKPKIDVRQLAESFRVAADQFWTNPSRSKKAGSEVIPARMKARRGSNEEREEAAFKSLAGDIAEEYGHRLVDIGEAASAAASPRPSSSANSVLRAGLDGLQQAARYCSEASPSPVDEDRPDSPSSGKTHKKATAKYMSNGKGADEDQAKKSMIRKMTTPARMSVALTPGADLVGAMQARQNVNDLGTLNLSIAE